MGAEVPDPGAGLSRTVLYRHFDGLPGVVLTLLEAITDELREALGRELEEAMADGRVANGHAGVLARALNRLNIHYLSDTLGRDPLLAVWAPSTSHAS